LTFSTLPLPSLVMIWTTMGHSMPARVPTELDRPIKMLASNNNSNKNHNLPEMAKPLKPTARVRQATAGAVLLVKLTPRRNTASIPNP
ncbi:hypothetical protein EGW08_022185, partial [Elysia chlorotica]